MPFEREKLQAEVQEKIKAGEPLVVHIHVPLCDNYYQGIVPVSKSLGDGFNLNTNLYWGARYGIKSHFKRATGWTLLESLPGRDTTTLERVIFYKQFPNQAKVYLVADAYRGDQMKACLMDFLNASAGRKNEVISVDKQSLALGSGADLLVFNGHNGLMDYYETKKIDNLDGQQREASVIGCISHEYFVDYLKQAQTYPLLMTTNLMAPEAYVAEALIEAWVHGKSGEAVRKAAGLAYHNYQKCGVKGATRLFQTGW